MISTAHPIGTLLLIAVTVLLGATPSALAQGVDTEPNNTCQTAQQFGAQSGSNRVSRDQARGFDRGGAGGASAGQRPSASTGAVGGRDVGASTRDAGASTRNAGASTRDAGAASRGSGSSAYSGSRNSSMDRSASSRGGSSRGGGMSRGGGGMSRGGGSRRR